MTQVKRLDLTKVCINLPTHLVNKVKLYAEENGIPVTQAYTILLNLAIDQKDAIKLLPKLLESFKKLDNNN